MKKKESFLAFFINLMKLNQSQQRCQTPTGNPDSLLFPSLSSGGSLVAVLIERRLDRLGARVLREQQAEVDIARG